MTEADDAIDDSFAENKFQDFSVIPTLKNNQNALNRQNLPFSTRLFSGQIKID